MKTRDKVALGLLAGAGALWGTRAFLRSRRWFDLRDRVAVVTGADSGLGLILCQQLAEHGAIVVMAARKAEELDEAAEKVRARGARAVLTVPTDVTDEGQSARLIGRTVEQFGRVDVLINNAGLMIVGAEPTFTIDDYRKLMDTNFWGAVYTSRAALPYMRSRQFGRIANISSVGGLFTIPHMTPYIASKFALTGYTKALRAEAGRDNILVTGVYPAPIRTGGHAHAWFKGDREAEYTWFGLTDTFPAVATSAETAARKTIRAIQGGDPEIIIGLMARLNVTFEGLFPDWSAEAVALVERTMPAPKNIGEPAVQGQDLSGTVADHVNQLVPTQARA